MKTITYILKCTDCDYTEKQQIVVPDNAKGLSPHFRKKNGIRIQTLKQKVR